MSYYDDFYEPSEYEMMVEEFKNTLRESVKQEWKDRMAKLEEENKSLQEIKNDWESIKKDYENLKNECEWERKLAIANAKQDAKKMRLKELMQDVQCEYWSVGLSWVKGEKCNKCNENRKIKYISPRGKEMYEDCKCADSKRIYAPKCNIIYELSLRSSGDNKLGMWFTEKKSDDCDNYYHSTDYFHERIIVKDDADIKELYKNGCEHLYFESEEKCQELCDLLNKKAGGNNE